MATVAYGIKENTINKSRITPSRKVKFDTRSKNLQKYRTENTYKSIIACMLTEFQKSPNIKMQLIESTQEKQWR